MKGHQGQFKFYTTMSHIPFHIMATNQSSSKLVVVVYLLSHVSFVAPWTVVCQALLSRGFPRQEYWKRLSSPSPGKLPDPGIKLKFPD